MISGLEKMAAWNLSNEQIASIPDVHTLVARMPEQFNWMRRTIAEVDFNTIVYEGDSTVHEEVGRVVKFDDQGHGRVGFVDRLLSPGQARCLSDYGTVLQHQGLLNPTDETQHRVKRVVAYNDPLHVYLMKQLLPLFEQISRVKLEPSYAYFSRYLPGSALLEHTDIPRCPYNVSIQLHVEACVDQEHVWPLCLKLKPIETLNVYLNDGDAVMYLGTQHPHWRSEMPLGIKFVDVLLFHYMPKS